MNAKYLKAQVVYKQGLVKDFICVDTIRWCDFLRQVVSFGKIRLVRSIREVKDISVEMESGNTTMIHETSMH